MENFYFKSKDKFYEAAFHECYFPEDPRESMTPLGTMVFKPLRNHSLGDIQSDFRDFYARQLAEKENGKTLDECLEMSEQELEKEWTKDQFVILPITVYIHDGITCHLSARRLSNADGFIFVNKDNEEVQSYIKSHGEIFLYLKTNSKMPGRYGYLPGSEKHRNYARK